MLYLLFILHPWECSSWAIGGDSFGVGAAGLARWACGGGAGATGGNGVFKVETEIELS